ncbi:MAG: NUDIX hydrolase [Alphaproteobacteria bacterium]|nr:NUDIX hydrolase [Alphaproteobacteria bacterium]
MSRAGRADRLAAYFAIAASHPHWFRVPAEGFRIVLDPDHIRAIEAETGNHYVARGQPSEWAEVGVQYQDPYLIVLRDAVVFPDGSEGIHHRTMRLEGEPSGVAVLPLMEDRIVLVRHYRHPTRISSWEIPRGGVERGASLEETVRAELQEEIGGVAIGVTELGLMYGASGFMGLGVRLYVARLSAVGAPAIGEGISRVDRFSLEDVDGMVLRGDITDSFTLGALLHARLRRLI